MFGNKPFREATYGKKYRDPLQIVQLKINVFDGFGDHENQDTQCGNHFFSCQKCMVPSGICYFKVQTMSWNNIATDVDSIKDPDQEKLWISDFFLNIFWSFFFDFFFYKNYFFRKYWKFSKNQDFRTFTKLTSGELKPSGLLI